MPFLLFLFIWWVLPAMLVAIELWRVGRNPVVWTLITLMFGWPVGFFVLLWTSIEHHRLERWDSRR